MLRGSELRVRLPQDEYNTILREQATHRRQMEALVSEHGTLLSRANDIRRLKAELRGTMSHDKAPATSLMAASMDGGQSPEISPLPAEAAPKPPALSSPSAKPSGAPAGIVAQLAALRDEYQHFAADASRVSSCRRMASEFSVKLTAIIKTALKP